MRATLRSAVCCRPPFVLPSRCDWPVLALVQDGVLEVPLWLSKAPDWCWGWMPSLALTLIPFSVRNGFSLSGQSSSMLLYHCGGHGVVRASYDLNFLCPIVWWFSCCLAFNHVPWMALSTRPCHPKANIWNYTRMTKTAVSYPNRIL